MAQAAESEGDGEDEPEFEQLAHDALDTIARMHDEATTWLRTADNHHGPHTATGAGVPASTTSSDSSDKTTTATTSHCEYGRAHNLNSWTECR